MSASGMLCAHGGGGRVFGEGLDVKRPSNDGLFYFEVSGVKFPRLWHAV